jgi:lipopolysaccharide O-acetyltransferase
MIIKNLRRPLPDLFSYILEKITSRIWKFYIKEVGNGFHLSHGAKIRGCKFIKIGDNFQTGTNVWIEAVEKHLDFEYNPLIEIGSFVRFSDNVHIACTNKVVIGNGVLFGSKVHITDHAHGIYNGENQDDPRVLSPTLRRLTNDNIVIIGDNVWLGDGVVVLPNVKIGSGSIVGANSVVTKDVPPNVIVVGSPATAVKRFNEKTEKWEKII